MPHGHRRSRDRRVRHPTVAALPEGHMRRSASVSHARCTLDRVSSFRLPDGVEFLGHVGGNAQFRVSIPLDDDGFFGRECPECDQHFRIAHESYDALPDDLSLWCVYCGHHDDHSEFMTTQQRVRVVRAATDYGMQLIGQTLDKSFGRMARRSRRSLVRMTYRSRPFYPAPLPEIDEESLVRERACGRCSLRYAIFGEHRFCPVCGLLPPIAAAEDALAAETARLDALAELAADVRDRLRESGVLDRTYVDAIENVVGVVETMADRTFRSLVPSADSILMGKGKVFQRLNDFADLFENGASVDIRTPLGAAWGELERVWAARHVFTHCDGMVDARYLHAVGESPLRVGQRLRVTEELARSAIRNAGHLCRAIAAEEV